MFPWVSPATMLDPPPSIDTLSIGFSVSEDQEALAVVRPLSRENTRRVVPACTDRTPVCGDGDALYPGLLLVAPEHLAFPVEQQEMVPLRPRLRSPSEETATHLLWDTGVTPEHCAVPVIEIDALFCGDGAP
jgi:hypothetical protein